MLFMEAEPSVNVHKKPNSIESTRSVKFLKWQLNDKKNFRVLFNGTLITNPFASQRQVSNWNIE